MAAPIIYLIHITNRAITNPDQAVVLTEQEICLLYITFYLFEKKESFNISYKVKSGFFKENKSQPNAPVKT